MNKLSISFESLFLQTKVHLTVALPYPNLVQKKPYKVLVALHCALKNGETFFDELGIGSYVDTYNTAVIAPDLGNSFFVDNSIQKVGLFLREELYPYLVKTLSLPIEKKDNYILGISMGGYGAANWALSEDSPFSKVFLISSVFDFFQERDERLNQKKDQKNLARYVDSLKNILLIDKNEYYKGCDIDLLLKNITVDSDMEFKLFVGDEDYLSLIQNEVFHRKLLDKGFEASLHISEGEHNTIFWKKALEAVFLSENYSS